MKAPHQFAALIIFSIAIFYSCGHSSKDSEASDQYSMSSIATEEVVDEAYPATSDYMDISGSDMKMEAQRLNGRVVAESPSAKKVPNFIATMAAQSINDGSRQLVRTAHIRMKTKEITAATYVIESIILKNKGFILNSSINNSCRSRSEFPISKDSSLIVSYNDLTASLTLRVPKDMLDEALREIAPLAVEIDYRRLTAEDMTYDIFSNELKQARMFRKSKRVSNAIATRSGKLNEAISAEESLDRVEEMADQAEFTKFTMKDKIDFSTIQIELYQDVLETKTMVKRSVDIDTYKPGIGYEILDSLSNGWAGLCSLILFLINFWPLFLIVIIGAFLYRKYKKKPKGK